MLTAISQTKSDSSPAETLVLFDFDGTLVRSFPAVLEGYRFAFRKVLDIDYPSTPEDLKVVGVARFKDLCIEKGGEENGPKLIEAFREHYLSDRLETPVELYDGVREALDQMVAAGLAIGIVTNKTRLGLDFDLERTGLDDLPLAAIVSAEDSVERKPHPRPLQIGLEQAGADPANAFYVGDGPHDVAAANAAGMRGIGVDWGDFDREPIMAAEPFAYAEHPSDMPGIVGAGDPVDAPA